MKIVNLGCGTKTHPDVINIDWSIYLRIKKNPFLRHMARIIMKGERLKKFNRLPDNIIVHDLSKELPFPEGEVDIVYHSHLLEHLEKHIARRFLIEIKRVLKTGGHMRVVVPDMELLCKRYIKHINKCDQDTSCNENHDKYISAIIEQIARKEAYGTSMQRPMRRFLENIILGDARKRGETHQWMYDRISLKHLLLKVGFRDVYFRKYNESSIPGWNNMGLDMDNYGNEYKPESLYVECKK